MVGLSGPETMTRVPVSATPAKAWLTADLVVAVGRPRRISSAVSAARKAR